MGAQGESLEFVTGSADVSESPGSRETPWWKRQETTVSRDCIEVVGSYDDRRDWINDASGYVLIRINRELGRLEAGLCVEPCVVSVVVYGEKPQDIYYEFAKRNLLSRPEHYAYLGLELHRAYLALQHGLEYVQDEEPGLDLLQS